MPRYVSVLTLLAEAVTMGEEEVRLPKRLTEVSLI